MGDDDFLEIEAMRANADIAQQLQWPHMPAKPITTLNIASIDAVNADEIKALLQQHGCTLDEHAEHTVLTFPEGTTRKEVLPRTFQARYDIFFPDGFFIQEVYIRHKQLSY